MLSRNLVWLSIIDCCLHSNKLSRYLLYYDSVGTFTLSNLGMFGVDRFDAILPPGTVSLYLLIF